MNKPWYTSQKRFNAKIVIRWEKRGFKYHAGHLQLLRFSYRTLMYWACINGAKVSTKNKVNTELKLF